MNRRIAALNRRTTSAALGDTGQSWTHFTGLLPAAKALRDLAKPKDRWLEVPYENRLERDFMVLLEADKNVAAYTPLPKPLGFKADGQFFQAQLEFCFVRSDRSRVLAAVKSKTKLAKYDLKELYEVLTPIAWKQQAAELEVWTEAEVRRQPRLANAEALVFQRASHPAGDKQREFTNTLGLSQALAQRGGIMSIGELREKSGLGDQAWRAILTSIENGYLRPCKPTELLDDYALVTSGPAA